MTLAAKHLAQLCQRVGTSLEAGIDIRRIWASESERGSRTSRRAASEVAQLVASGQTTTDAMTASGAFPPMVCQMVEVGEQAGRLDETFPATQRKLPAADQPAPDVSGRHIVADDSTLRGGDDHWAADLCDGFYWRDDG